MYGWSKCLENILYENIFLKNEKNDFTNGSKENKLHSEFIVSFPPT